MRSGLLKTAALAVTLTCPMVLAAEPSATDRCMTLMEGDEIVDEAVTACAAAAKESREGLLLYGDILSWQGNSKGAIEHYSKVLEGADPKSYDDVALGALWRRAWKYFQAEAKASAFKDATAFIEYEPEDTDMLFIAAVSASNPESALPLIERAIALDPEDIHNRAAHIRLLLDTGKKREALAVSDKLVKIAPKDSRALLIKGATHNLLGEYAQAERWYAKAAQAAPKNPEPKAERANALVKLGRHKEAITVATAALQDDPNFFDAWLARVSAHLAMGDGQAALADIQQAKKVQPRWDASAEQSRAEKLIEIHRVLSPAGIAKAEADRATVLRGITRHMHSQCGNFRLPQFSPDMNIDQLNSDMNRYRNCLSTWNKIPEVEIYDSLTPAEVAAGERLYDAQLALADADELSCSNMPKGAKCIDSNAYAKAQSVLENMDEPITYVRNFEVNRFNSDLAALNKAISRHNRGRAIADFVQGVAEALNE